MTSNSTVDQLGVNKPWELSLYELHRTPQEAITDDTEIAVSPRSLHNELMCPICLEILNKTMTTKECLHRFCSDCIITALRSGNKECPTCRKKLVSKRSLRPDPNFDLLISKIYPSRDEYEAHQTKILEKLNKTHSQAALVQSINEGLKLQNQIRLRTNKKSQNENDNSVVVDSTVGDSNQNGSQTPCSTSAGLALQSTVSGINIMDKNVPGILNVSSIKSEHSDSAESTTESGSVSEGSWCGPTSVDEIELVFKPHPNESKEVIKSMKEGSVRYLKTTANATMSHLCKYLETRASLDSDLPQMSFSVHASPNPGNFIALNEAETLRNVVDKHWRNNKPVELYYTSKKIKKGK